MEKGSKNSVKEIEADEPNLSFMDTAFDSIWVVDNKYCLKYGNFEFSKNFKLLTGKTIRKGDCLFPANLSAELNRKWKTYYDLVLNTGESCSVELESLVSHTDSFTQYSFSPVYSNGDKISGVLVIGRDITLKKQAEVALKKSEQHARALIEVIPDMIFRLDTKGTFIDFKAERDDLYIKPEQFIGKNIADVMPEWFSKLVMGKIALASESNEIEVLEYELPNINNELLQFECRLLPFSSNEVIAIVRNITERKRIEKRLRESEIRARVIMESTNDSLFLIDETGTILDFNKAFINMFGLAPQDYQGVNILSILPDNITRQYRHLITQVLNTARPYHDETYWNGVWSEFSIYPVAIKDGLPDSIAVYVKDITIRKKAEEELRASNKFVTNLIESMQDGFSVIDSDGVHVMVNDAICKMTGYSSDELIGCGLPHPYWPSEDQKKIEAALKQTENHDSYSVELVFKHKNGTRFPVIVSSVKIHDGGNSKPIYAATVKDITGLKQAESSLIRSEAKYRYLHKSMRDGFVNVDMQGRILEFNGHYQKMLGYDSDELLKLTYFDLTPQKWFEYEKKIVEEQIIARGYSDIYVKEYIKKNGEVIPVEFRTVLIKDETGENTGMWAIVREISERVQTEAALKESEKRLREMNAAKDKYFSIIAHDLKSPFHSIIGFSEVLKKDARNIDISAIENYASIIHDSATQTLRLLENLLDWARVQQDEIAFKIKMLVFKEVFNEAAGLMADHAQRKNISLHHNIPCHIIVRADENMLKSIMRNLLSNAVKFTKPGGSVTVTAGETKKETIISVADTGIGISKENIDKLFNIHSNFNTRGTGQEKGTGIGLMLCKEFIEKHGGRIWVESEPGKGSRFYFTIPLK